MKKFFITTGFVVLSSLFCFTFLSLADNVESYDEALSAKLNENVQRNKNIYPDMGEEISEDAGPDVGQESDSHITEEDEMGRD